MASSSSSCSSGSPWRRQWSVRRSISSSVTNAPWMRAGRPSDAGLNSMSPCPRSDSAPFWSRITRESVWEETANAMRAGTFALIIPVMMSALGRWVASSRWIPTARDFWASRMIASSTSPGAIIMRSASSSITHRMYGSGCSPSPRRPLVGGGGGGLGGGLAVRAPGLPGAGGPRHEDVRLLREVGADCLAGDVLAQPHGQRRPAGRRLLEDVAEVHQAAVRVRDLDPDRLLAGNRREDPDLGGGERVRQVVLELGDLRHLGSGLEAELVARHVRARHGAHDLRLDPEVAERLHQRRARALLGRHVHARAPLRALEERRLREPVLHVGRLGHVGAAIALGRELLGRGFRVLGLRTLGTREGRARGLGLRL